MMALDTGVLGIERRSIRQTMTQVMVALLPGTILYATIIDYHVITNIVIASLFALCCEALCLKLRKRRILPTIGDGSIVLASWLLVLCLPPSLPIWQLLIGVATLVLLGKHLFGGLGHNPFNPAMVAYAVLLVSFPVTMTDWDLGQHRLPALQTNLTDDRGDIVSADANLHTSKPPLETWDGISGATVLDRLRDLKRVTSSELLTGPANSAVNGSETDATLVLRRANNSDPTGIANTEIATNSTLNNNTIIASPNTDEQADIDNFLVTKNTQQSLSDVGRSVLGTPWVWVSLGWLVGGLYLLWQRIISWQIPAYIVCTIAVLYVLAGAFATSVVIPMVPALLSGGIMLGAFFIATDPVSAAASRYGQILYGVGIGAFTFFIREFSVYPEGFAFAVLLMNLCVPLIDHISTGKEGRMSLSDTH